MACFSLQWLEQLLIWFLIVCFVVAVVKLLVPVVAGWFGAPGSGTVVTILGWLVGLLIAIWLIIIIFDLIGCLFGAPGLGVGFPLRGVR